MRSFHNCHSSPLQALKLCGGPAGSTHLSPLLLLQGHGQDHPILGSPLKTRTHRTARAEAIASSFVVASTSSPMSPDAPVLLQTGGLLVFTFWFFNFFMTDQISKLYGFDKLDEEEEEEEDEDSADGSPSEVPEPNMPPSVASSQATSATKKQGFGNYKPKTKTKTKTKTKS